jgi:glucose-1-phosphate cytidylyltransferase
VGEEIFLANYSDGLSDLPLDAHVAHFVAKGKIASFLSVKPNLSFHVVQSDEHGRVTAIEDIAKSHLRINGGFFLFKQEIFKYMRDGEDLVNEPFQRLLQQDELLAYTYDGFWQAMDTFKDRQSLEELHSKGTAPWTLWNSAAAASSREPVILGPRGLKAHIG